MRFLNMLLLANAKEEADRILALPTVKDIIEGRAGATGVVTIFVFREKHGLAMVHAVASQVDWGRLRPDDRVDGATWVEVLA